MSRDFQYLIGVIAMIGGLTLAITHGVSGLLITLFGELIMLWACRAEKGKVGR
jgi:hypothetical protein